VSPHFPLIFPLYSSYFPLVSSKFPLIHTYFKAFPEADLKITLAGHSGMEKENIRELVIATEKFKNL
jgi:hypothetical protein